MHWHSTGMHLEWNVHILYAAVVAQKPETKGREKQVVNFVYSFKGNTYHEKEKDTQAA